MCFAFFQIGRKDPLDLTTSRKLPSGLRWELPMYLLDALFICTEGRGACKVGTVGVYGATSLPSSPSATTSASSNAVAQGTANTTLATVSSTVSREAERILTGLGQVIQNGFAEKCLQKCPHLVLLRRAFYHAQMKPWLAQWIMIWLNSLAHEGTLTDEQTLQYLLLEPTKKGPTGQPEQSIKQRALGLGIHEEMLPDEWLKLLNLAREWIHSLLPFVLGKINRVSFGLLHDLEIERALVLDPHMAESRKKTGMW